jgi:hypothetical protein
MNHVTPTGFSRGRPECPSRGSRPARPRPSVRAPSSGPNLSVLEDALVAGAEEITCDLVPGSVELRLRGRDPEFVVRQPAGFAGEPSGAGPDEAGAAEGPAAPATGAGTATETGEGGTARVNLRMPDQLKARAEQAAANERVSLNAWLVRAVTAAVDRAGPPKRDGSATAERRQRDGSATAAPCRVGALALASDLRP